MNKIIAYIRASNYEQDTKEILRSARNKVDDFTVIKIPSTKTSNSGVLMSFCRAFKIPFFHYTVAKKTLIHLVQHNTHNYLQTKLEISQLQRYK